MHMGEEGDQLYLQTSGMSYLETEDGIQAFQQILPSRTGPVLVLTGAPDRLQEYLDRDSPKTANTGSKDLDSGSEPELELHHLQEKLEMNIREIAGKIIKMNPAKMVVTDNFGKYGFDSISMKEFAIQLGKTYQIELAPTVFFQHNSIKALSEYMNTQFANETHHYYKKTNIKKNQATGLIFLYNVCLECFSYHI